jgi:hypothetical protein
VHCLQTSGRCLDKVNREKMFECMREGEISEWLVRKIEENTQDKKQN